MPRIPALGRLGQENCNAFEAKPGLCNKYQTSQRYIAEKNKQKRPEVVVHACDPNTGNMKVGGSRPQDYAQLCCEIWATCDPVSNHQ